MKENKVVIGVIILIVIVIAVAVGLYSYSVKEEPQLLTFEVDKANKQFVVTGSNLVGVDILIAPANTTGQVAQYRRLTTMTQENEGVKNQRWVAHIPVQQFAASSIIAKGYNDQEEEAGTKTLPYNGSAEINNEFKEFWTIPAATTTATTTIKR